ncbi:hypothetical protein BH11ACT3_BH11ACT3_23530 [soil metagenome]
MGRTTSTGSACLVGSGCGGAVDPDAPLALCELHLALAADWAQRESGVTDLLPAPCRACGSRLGIHYLSGWICAVCEWRYGETADGELAPPRVDVVYYLRHGDRVKIGTTANPRQRFGALWHDEVLAFERGDRKLEQRRHAQFADDRIGRSEWFRLSEPIAVQVETIMGGGDPWELHALWMSEAVALRG